MLGEIDGLRRPGVGLSRCELAEGAGGAGRPGAAPSGMTRFRSFRDDNSSRPLIYPGVGRFANQESGVSSLDKISILSHTGLRHNPVNGIVSLQTLAPCTAELAGRARKGHRRWTGNRAHLAPHLQVRRVPAHSDPGHRHFSHLARRRTNSSGQHKHLCCMNTPVAPSRSWCWRGALAQERAPGIRVPRRGTTHAKRAGTPAGGRMK